MHSILDLTRIEIKTSSSDHASMSENGKLFITLSNSLNLNCTTPNLNQANGDYFNLGANNIFSGKESLGNCSEFPFPSKVNDNDANAVSKHFKTWNLVFATKLLRSLRMLFPERDTDSTIFCGNIT